MARHILNDHLINQASMVGNQNTSLLLSAVFYRATGNDDSPVQQVICQFIIWLAPWAGKMNQILCCDWLPKQARRSYLAPLGLPAVYRKENFPESHIINPLLTKLVQSMSHTSAMASWGGINTPHISLGNAQVQSCTGLSRVAISKHNTTIYYKMLTWHFAIF